MLDPLRHSVLAIKYLDGAPLLFQWPPEEGWTFEILDKIQPRGVEFGANAYINDVWIGTTEW
ncbi:hypothetical protein F384_26455 (plasmid) [Citrobacter amalonaticus Y19]|uniref:Uncharacterized protein n=2 Tax=Enterobacteriaceae TaxID=543 RepID=A0A837LMY1_9ENTR|nr:hypothetical protein F384_26455 [Citrobacter amalonaticus Y19]KLQ08236.1 hypothetical protein ABF77_00235 [Enterobacter roggenkampii]